MRNGEPESGDKESCGQGVRDDERHFRAILNSGAKGVAVGLDDLGGKVEVMRRHDCGRCSKVVEPDCKE